MGFNSGFKGLNPLKHEIDKVPLPHHKARQSTRSILPAANRSLLVIRIIHTADTIQSSLCSVSCNNHCASGECGSTRTSHPEDQDRTHSRTAIVRFKVGYWVKERETAWPRRSQRCIFLKML